MVRVFSILLLAACSVFGQAFTLRNPIPGGVAAPSPLLNNLISYWKMDENISSGSRSDSVDGHPWGDNGNHVTNAVGIIGLAAASGASTMFLTNADHADFSGGVSFSIQTWVKFTSVVNNAPIIAKWGASPDIEWVFLPLSGSLQWIVRDLVNVANVSVTATTPSTGAWHHLCVGFDSTNQVIWLQVDGAARATTAYLTAVRDTTIVMMLGQYSNFSGNNFSGAIDEVGYWKRVLTSAEVVQLYNSGAGLAHPFN